MTAAEALVTIQGLAAANRIRFSGHALDRAIERGASWRHVRCALVSAVSCVDNGGETWKVTGPDLDGDALTCIVAIEDAVVVITVF